MNFIGHLTNGLPQFVELFQIKTLRRMRGEFAVEPLRQQ